MPRRSTAEVAEVITDRLMNRGAQGSREWVRARVLRWGTTTAELTKHNPTYVPPTVTEVDGDYYQVGPDRVLMHDYREWVDVQDGSRTIRGDKHGHVVWKD